MFSKEFWKYKWKHREHKIKWPRYYKWRHFKWQPIHLPDVMSWRNECKCRHINRRRCKQRLLCRAERESGREVYWLRLEWVYQHEIILSEEPVAIANVSAMGVLINGLDLQSIGPWKATASDTSESDPISRDRAGDRFGNNARGYGWLYLRAADAGRSCLGSDHGHTRRGEILIQEATVGTI